MAATTADTTGTDTSGDPFMGLLNFGVQAFNQISADVSNTPQPTQKAPVTGTPAPVPVNGTKSPNMMTMLLFGVGAIVVLKVLKVF